MPRPGAALFAILVGCLVIADLPAAAAQPLPVRARVPMLSGDSGQYRPPFHFPTSIDYSNPSAYLEQGTQSTLSAQSRALLDSELSPLPAGLSRVAAIFRWMQAGFRTEPSGGQTIGKTDVDSLLESRTVTGCHDWALVMTSVLRHYGIPAVMVDTAGIQWAFDFAAGQTMAHIGHVFGEPYVDGRWIIIDCTSGLYGANYDPLHPVLPFTNPVEPRGFYVLYKGVDPAGYGVTDSEVLADRFRAFASVVEELKLPSPDYEIRSLLDVR